jgi:hypothetical protein
VAENRVAPVGTNPRTTRIGMSDNATIPPAVALVADFFISIDRLIYVDIDIDIDLDRYSMSIQVRNG